MIMPFVRLITIYVLVGVAVFIVFNRDGLKQMLGIAGDGASVAYSDPSLPPIPPAAPVAEDQVATPENDAAPATDVAKADATAQATVAPPAQSAPAATPAPQATPAPRANDVTASAAVTAPAPKPKLGVTVPKATPAPVAANEKPAAEAVPLTPPTPTPVPTTTALAEPQPQAQPQEKSASPKDDATRRQNAARAAYWKGDSKTAEKLYKALIADFPNRVDFAGELGNIYYSSGRVKLAAPYYKRVARDLLATGQTARAQAMLSVLQAIAPQMADELRKTASKTN